MRVAWMCVFSSCGVHDGPSQFVKVVEDAFIFKSQGFQPEGYGRLLWTLDAIAFWTRHENMNSLSIPPFGGGP